MTVLMTNKELKNVFFATTMFLYSQTRSSVPPKKPLMNLLFKS